MLLACALLSQGDAAIARTQGSKLLVAIIDQVMWGDLLAPEVRAPTLRRLMKEGGVGMMCVRTARASGRGGGYLTIGAGSRASSSSSQDMPYPEGWAFQADEIIAGEPAGRVFRSYTGWPAGDNAIVHLAIGELMRENMSFPYPLSLGLLGSALRRSGRHVACLGNADTKAFVHREVVAIAMDGQGLVELGSIGPRLTQKQPGLPYQLATDAAALLSTFRRVAAAADLIVVDFGETSRVSEYADLMPPGTARKARYRAIERADRLLGQMVSPLPRSEWAVLVVTPNARPADPDEQFASLTPVLLRAPGEQPGLLTSPSTRRSGLVVNTDLAPTILSYFGLQVPSEMVGRAMRVEPVTGDAVERLRADVERENAAETVRRHAFRWLPALAAVGLWASAGLFLLGEKAPRWARKLLRGWLLVLLSAPPMMLLVTLRALPSWQMVAAIAAGAAGLAALSGWITGWRSGHALPAVLMLAAPVYDLLRGAGMLQWSPLSYSAGAGARFYGIGNEYAGALLGAALIAVASLSSRRELSSWGERLLGSAVLLGTAALVGHPRFGANLGMALAAAIAGAVFALYLWRERPTWGDTLGALALAGLIVSAAVAVDIGARGAEASHVGRFISSVRSEGWPALGQVMVRKWTMNWMLLRASLWTDVAIAALGCLAVWLLARPGRALAAMGRPWLMQALTASVLGAVASWVLNDSGIIAAAMVLLYGVGSLAYLGLGEPQPAA